MGMAHETANVVTDVVPELASVAITNMTALIVLMDLLRKINTNKKADHYGRPCTIQFIIIAP
jgi:hypothetical protein